MTRRTTLFTTFEPSPERRTWKTAAIAMRTFRSRPDDEHEFAPDLPGRLLGQCPTGFRERICRHGNAQTAGDEVGQLRDPIDPSARLDSDQAPPGQPLDIEGARQGSKATPGLEGVRQALERRVVARAVDDGVDPVGMAGSQGRHDITQRVVDDFRGAPPADLGGALAPRRSDNVSSGLA